MNRGVLLLIVACAAACGGGGSGGGGGSSGAAATGPSTGAPGPVPVRAGTFATAGRMTGGRFFHSATTLADGRVLVAGGLATASFLGSIPVPLQTAEVYDPAGGGFQATFDMTTVRFSHRAVLEPGGTVLLLGGDLLASVDRFDPRSLSFTSAGGLLAARAQHTATALPSGRILVTGGVTVSISFGGVQTTALRSTEVFDPFTGASAPGPDMPAARVGHSAVAWPGGDVLIVGGIASSAATLIYRAATGTLDPGPPLVEPREDQAATLLPDGRVLVTGGSGPGGVSRFTAEVLDPGAAAFRLLPAAVPGGPREDHTQTLLPNGAVLVTGGEDNAAGPGGQDVIVPTAALFDPKAETFLALPDTTVPRDDHRAALLGDGSVLLTGGEDAAGVGIPSAERYLP